MPSIPDLDFVNRIAAANALPALNAIGNTKAGLAGKGTADGPQFADGSRWVWSATGPANGGTIVAGSSGYWKREITGGTVSARWFGILGDGTDESALLLSVLQTARGQGWRLYFPRTAAYYNVGNGVEVLAVGNNYTIEADPATEFRTSNGTAPWVFSFGGVGDNFTLSGGVYSWGVTPTVRGGAGALYVSGTAMTNVVAENFRVKNSVNFAIWIRGQAGSGSHTVRASNIIAQNTLGDGVHVENFDHSVTISDIQTENNGDDAVAVVQYTGTSGASTNLNPCVGVTITNVFSRNPMLAVVKFQGVSQAAVSNITATGGANSGNAVLLQLNGAADYSVANTDVSLVGCVATGLRAIFSAATVGSGNSHARYQISKIVGSNISGDPFFFSGVSAAAADMKDIWIDGVSLTGAAGNAGRPLFASQVNGLHVRNFKAVGFGGVFQVSNSVDVELENIEIRDPIAVVDGIVLTTNARLRIRRLIAVDSQTVKKLARGMLIQANTDLVAFGGCEVSGQTGVAVLGGSNTGFRGFIDESTESVTVGTVVAAGVYSRTYAVAPIGSYVLLSMAVNGDAAIRAVARNVGPTACEFVWGDPTTNVSVHYTARGILA